MNTRDKISLAVGCFSMAFFLLGAAVDTDGNAITMTTDMGDIDMAVTTVGDFKNAIVPNYDDAPSSFGFGVGTCSTEAETTDKTVLIANHELKTGGIVVITFSYAVKSAATLSINGGDAYSIYYKGGLLDGGEINAGDTATLMFTGDAFELLAVDSAVRPKIYYATCSTAASTAAKVVSTQRYAVSTTDNDFTYAVGTILVVKFTNYNTATSPYLRINGETTGTRYVRRYGGTSSFGSSHYSWNSGEAVPFLWDGTSWQMLKQSYHKATTSEAGIVQISDSTNSTLSAGYAATPKAVRDVRQYVDTKVGEDSVTNLVWDIYTSSHRYFYDEDTQTTYRQVISNDFYMLIAVTNVPPSYEVIKELEKSN